MRGARFEWVILRRADLRRAFAADFAERLTGATVLDVARRAKYLMVPLSTGDTLVMHLGMSGEFRIAPASSGFDADPASEPSAHDHVVFGMSSGWIVTINDVRRFGAMDLLSPAELSSHATLATLGPEPLSRAFTADWLAAACARRQAPLKAALLDQRVVAGLGNIYAVEALHRAGISPFRAASSIATANGTPRSTAVRLVAAIRHVLRRAIARQTRGPYRSARFRAYDREGLPCATPGCPGTIERRVQAGRSTFFCATCQR